LKENELKRVVENLHHSTLEDPEVIHTIELLDFRRGIFKIAYELAFRWLGEEYLSDPMAAKLRDVIIGNANIEITRSIFDTNPDLFRLWKDDKNAHIAYTSVHDQNVIINIRILNLFFATVVVSEMKHRYIKGQQDPQHVRFLYNDPINKNRRESSQIDECGRIAAAMLATASNH
jgi:hypothetical protein